MGDKFVGAGGTIGMMVRSGIFQIKFKPCTSVPCLFPEDHGIYSISIGRDTLSLCKRNFERITNRQFTGSRRFRLVEVRSKMRNTRRKKK